MQDDNDLSAKPQNIKTDPPESTHEEPLDNELQPQPMPANQQEPEAPHSQDVLEADASRRKKKERYRKKRNRIKTMASDLGRKVFVGNLSYEYEPRQNPVHHKESDVDTTKGELESKHAMFVSAVRKTAVTSVFSQFGKIECLRSWETNKTPEFFFVVYETNDMAKYTVTTLADTTTGSTARLEACYNVTKQKTVPQWAVPLPSFYVRWPKDYLETLPPSTSEATPVNTKIPTESATEAGKETPNDTTTHKKSKSKICQASLPTCKLHIEKTFKHSADTEQPLLKRVP